MICANISVKPVAYGKTQQDNSRLEPWFVQEEQGQYTVTVPADVESFGDDPAAVACYAAVDLLKANIVIGHPMKGNNSLWERCHSEVDLFYFGVAAILKEQQVGPYHNYSGWFGRGYNLMARRRLSMAGIRPWAIRGSTTPLRKVFSHKGWGESLPAGYKHLEVLLRLAADKLNLNKELAAQWMVPLSSLKGNKIKKALASDKLGFLLQPDVDALHKRFESEIKEFHSLDSELSRPTMDLFIGLEDKITSANKAVRNLEALSAHIIDTRAKVLYPPEKGKIRKRKKKVTLKDKLLECDPVLFINRFGPYEACGIAPFTSSEEAAFAEDGSLKIASLTSEFEQYTRRHPAWEDVLRSYWNTEFLVRFS
jgi:hypothetical protein